MAIQTAMYGQMNIEARHVQSYCAGFRESGQPRNDFSIQGSEGMRRKNPVFVAVLFEDVATLGEEA